MLGRLKNFRKSSVSNREFSSGCHLTGLFLSTHFLRSSRCVDLLTASKTVAAQIVDEPSNRLAPPTLQDLIVIQKAAANLAYPCAVVLHKRLANDTCLAETQYGFAVNILIVKVTHNLP